MARIAVVHPDVASVGGAESVCAHVLEALQGDHDVDLVTFTDVDVAELNGHYDTQVSDVDVVVPDVLGVNPKTVTDPLARAAGVPVLGRLETALLNRAVRRIQDRYDLVFSARGECPTEVETVQYVHFPVFNKAAQDEVEKTSDTLAWRTYGAFAHWLGGPSRDAFAGRDGHATLSPSAWSAEITRDIYGVEPTVVYPPVPVEDLRESDAETDPSRIVTVGRIGPDKRQAQCVDVVRDLRERGHDVDLHVVGPVSDESYHERLRRRASDLEFVHLEGRVSRPRLVELVAASAFGLNARRYEHFGIVIAEFVAAGTIPFVHDSGGAPEVVGEDDRLVFADVDEAVEKMDRVLADPDLQATIREALPDVEARFGRERFERRVRETVERTLADDGER